MFVMACVRLLPIPRVGAPSPKGRGRRRGRGYTSFHLLSPSFPSPHPFPFPFPSPSLLPLYCTHVTLILQPFYNYPDENVTVSHFINIDQKQAILHLNSYYKFLVIYKILQQYTSLQQGCSSDRQNGAMSSNHVICSRHKTKNILVLSSQSEHAQKYLHSAIIFTNINIRCYSAQGYAIRVSLV